MKIISLLLLVVVWVGCGGYGSNNNAPPQPGVVPNIAELVPDSANSGSPDFTLTINGSGFNSDAIVKWNGTNQPTTYVTAKQLTAAIPATNITSPGTATIAVTNPGKPAGGPYGAGGTRSETSNAMNFMVN
jgi:IPT/TIG domain